MLLCILYLVFFYIICNLKKKLFLKSSVISWNDSEDLMTVATNLRVYEASVAKCTAVLFEMLAYTLIYVNPMKFVRDSMPGIYLKGRLEWETVAA